MKHIAICTSEISYGDAVSNDVFGMFNVLKNYNCKVNIFVEKIFVSNPSVININEIGNFIRNNDDVLIYHLSTGWSKGLDLLTALNCRKVIKYHNITPPDYFYGFSSDHVSNCKGGLEHLNIIAGLDVDLYLSDSLFNMNEMISSGSKASKNFVVYPFNNIERLIKIKPDFNILDMYNDGKVNILSVGRIAPNKGFADLIDSFARYRERYDKESRLIIVGNQSPALSAYSEYLYDKVRYLDLSDYVIFTGKVTDEQLKTYYLVTKVFVMASYHEGFCVPVVEAMRMKIPVVVYGSTAVHDTVGDAGIVWEEPDINLIAASINEIVTDENVYFYLGEMGWRRYKNNFTNRIIEKKFLDIIGKYL